MIKNLLLLFPSERVLKQSGPLFILHLAHHSLLKDHKHVDDNDNGDGDHDGGVVDGDDGNLPFDSKLFAERSDNDD